MTTSEYKHELAALIRRQNRAHDLKTFKIVVAILSVSVLISHFW